jgi:hypothetical protein
MELGEVKLSTIQKITAFREAKASKDNFDVEYVFDTFAERYDKWYDKPLGKTCKVRLSSSLSRK